MTAVSGRRDDLIAILADAVSNMPWCLSYIVAKDSGDENTVWVTEVWDSKENHDCIALVAGSDQGDFRGKTDDLAVWQSGDNNPSGRVRVTSYEAPVVVFASSGPGYRLKRDRSQAPICRCRPGHSAHGAKLMTLVLRSMSSETGSSVPV